MVQHMRGVLGEAEARQCADPHFVAHHSLYGVGRDAICTMG